MTTQRARVAAFITGLAILAAPVATAATAAAASGSDDVIAVDATPAPPASPSPTAVGRVIGIDANLPGGLTVTGAGSSKVSVSTKGQNTRSAAPNAAGTATFRNLTPGRTYSVAIAGKRVGTAVPLAVPGAAYGLTVSTTAAADEVLLRWNQQPAKAQGAVTYFVTATPITSIGRSASSDVVSGMARESVATMVIDPGTRYTFTVTPRNTAATGPASTAAMTRPLRELKGTTEVPTEPAPKAPAAPAPAAPAAPPAPSGPSTKTIYVCPQAYTETTGGLCEKTLAYTYTTTPYTYHSEAVYGYGQVDWAYSWGYCTGTGKSGNWPNGDPYCQTPVYGDNAVIGSQQVKDATPAGYTDTGSAWTKKDPIPAGYADNGTAWVTTAAKVATVVPA